MNASSFTFSNGDTHQVARFDTGVEFGAIAREEVTECAVNEKYFVFYSQVTSTGTISSCGIRCPFPACTISETRIMWMFYCLPAVGSLPLNTLIVCAKFLSPLKQTRSAIKTAVVGTAAVLPCLSCGACATPSLR
jgi:hypothetical protein